MVVPDWHFANWEFVRVCADIRSGVCQGCFIMRVEKKIFDLVMADASADELRQIANDTGVDLSDLYEARRARQRYWNGGVKFTQRKYR